MSRPLLLPVIGSLGLVTLACVVASVWLGLAHVVGLWLLGAKAAEIGWDAGEKWAQR